MNSTQTKPRFYYGWVIVAVIALAGFSQTAETFPVLGVFLKPITEEFGWSRTVFSGAMSIGTVIGGFLALGIGPLIDRFGARWTLVIAFVILGGTLILLAGIQTLWQFYALQILGRMMSHGVIALAIFVVVPKWFHEKRGRAMALSQMGHRIGNTVTPLYVQILVNVASWRLAAAVTGLVMWVVSLLPVAAFLRRSPEDMGLLPDGATKEELDRYIETSRNIYELPLYIDETPAITISTLRNRARRIKRLFGLSIIVVDYIQLMRTNSKKYDGRVQEISEITQGLKALAKELSVPVLALSQLSRAVEQRDDKIPQLSDLRESGSIEQDADVVLFVFREEYYLEKKQPKLGSIEHAEWQSKMNDINGLADIIIGKQRHGPTGNIHVAFEGMYTKFKDLQQK